MGDSSRRRHAITLAVVGPIATLAAAGPARTVAVVSPASPAAACAACPSARQGARGGDAREYELEILKPVFEKYYQAGSDYYQNGWRSEALWCFERATKLLPEFGGLTRFVSLLRDFDNPVWKRKKWKSPRAAVDAGFKRKKESYDLAYAQALLRIGSHHARRDQDPALAERARQRFFEALEIVGGPYETDASGCIVAGKAGSIPADFSRRMLQEDLVVINGRRWLRDSMLRQLKDVSTLHEARSERCLVRTVTTEEQAKRLLALLEQAHAVFVRELGERRTSRPLGLFVFADPAAYEEWCKASEHADHAKAAGFANGGEGFAVTFEQPQLEETAVHEAAHLHHFDVYASAMPSWYEEGVAESFGDSRSMVIAEDGRLTTFLPPTKAALAPLLEGGRLAIALDDLLHGDATAKINADDGGAVRFYLGSWALYRFLRSTKDPRFAARFDDWEGFALGSRWERGRETEDATRLFDRVFEGVKVELEAAFTEWLADPR